MPRVAIDVQREYVALARLYYETGFRRYERALKYAREKARRRENRAAALIAEVMPSGKYNGRHWSFLSKAWPLTRHRVSPSSAIQELLALVPMPKQIPGSQIPFDSSMPSSRMDLLSA